MLPVYKIKKTEKHRSRKETGRILEDAYISPETIRKAQEGDVDSVEYIMKKYKDFVRVKAVPYFLIGGMKEDVIQEGMIGLYKAIRDFDSTKETAFKSFAELCIKRQILTAVKASTRKKHTPLNKYISLNAPVEDQDSEKSILELMTGASGDPEELLIGKENIIFIKKRVKTLLSPFEIKVLNLYLSGISYAEMGEILGKHSKSVDNAIQRIKRKLEKLIQEMNR